ncbi:2-isopropylmalate synthase [bacterium]|nr:2-isopropylmalate synthase [bacterium]
MPDKVYLFDTTLRDGEQSPGASLYPEEKLQIAQQLARLGVDVIEAGFPISSRGDFEAVKQIAEMIEGPIICGLARAKEEDIKVAGEALRLAKRKRIHTFIATSEIHMKKKLEMTPQEVKKAAIEAVKLAREFTDDVEFSAEDATRSDVDFLCEVFEAVLEVGATTINIPDTVGYALPWEFGELVRKIKENVRGIDKAIISVHCHNDLGLAVANSLSALMNGARQVEGTINGIGERAGNAALEEVIMTIVTRKDAIPFRVDVDTTQIYRTSRLVSDLTGLPIQPNKAIVGDNAFAHEAGIHVHGVMKDRRTYEIIDPRQVGIPQSRIVLGKHSGRHAFEEKIRELGYELSREELARAYVRFKEIADRKKGITDRDIEAIISDEIFAPPETFRLDYVQVTSGSGLLPTATVRLTKEESSFVESAVGVGPVDAIYKAIAKVFSIPHQLVDFRVESITGETEALGEVTVRVEKDGRIHSGKGASQDILEAAAKAYVQALNKLLAFSGKEGR